MNLVTALFLVILLASSSYAAGRLHAQLGYRLGFRTGYRQGFGDGDRAAWLYRRKEALRDAGSRPASAVPSPNAVPAVMTVATPPATQAAPPAGPSRKAGRPALAAAGGAGGDAFARPPQQPVVRSAAQAGPVSAPPIAAPARPFAPPERSLVRPAGRGVGMRGTMYHSTGALAIRGGRHAHPE